MLESTDSGTNRRSRRKNRSSAAAVRSKEKSMKKPDPNAAEITFQCTECSKVFRSEKAQHGHMRLHPEREWRGIIPPPSFRRRRLPVSASPCFPATESKRSSVVTEEEQDIADCLILLSNGPNFIDRVSGCRFERSSCKKMFGSNRVLEEHSGSHKSVKCGFAIAMSDEETEDCSLFRASNLHDQRLARSSCSGVSDFRFECSSCKRVFESQQALEEHSGSCKNVKCRFAIAKSNGETEECCLFRAINLNDEVSVISGTGLVRSSCSRVFSTGKKSAVAEQGCVDLDLNMPAPDEDGSSSSTYSSGIVLDLRLGL